MDALRAHRAVAATAAGSVALTLSAVAVYQYFSRSRRRRDLNLELLDSVHINPPPVPADPQVMAVQNEGYDEQLVREQLARNYAFFGDEAMEKVRASSVVVVGCGGVGSWAAVMLARSGVSKIRLIDFDYVTLSSLNRHATALLSDVGTPKVHCVARTLRQIAKWADIDSRVDLWKADDSKAAEELLEGADWVIDAIDNITTKVDLLRFCYERNIKVFSSMGAGAKSDPTRIQIADISETTYDPLARAVRRKLRYPPPARPKFQTPSATPSSVTDSMSSYDMLNSEIEEKPAPPPVSIVSGIPVVYSTEVPSDDLGLLPLSEEEFAKGQVHELAALDDFRVRILPVLGPLPSIFGLHIATYLISDLAGRPIVNPLPVRFRKRLYEKLFKELSKREMRLAGVCEGLKMPFTENDAGFVLEDLHRGRSILPPHNIPARPTLVRWRPDEGVSLKNLVVMEKEDADKHEADVLLWAGLPGQVTMEPESVERRLEGVWGSEVIQLVARRHKEVDAMFDWAL
ncbi:hypothetical protein EXIGLDRAFT_735761 [Exidia glandulosa HHB12029]|uniref:THIF-type NAD/FAD binding fold domain-containing protein n=1 Tax=Exidia glandulosa HHB12029 TaxID=1314781 RepID=A0A165PK96_EXIGL|nr:hypothetical protein EXIGLDRAFT_735761 [Exidia glandulosa HHB12029]